VIDGTPAPPPLEMWAGVECTVNRVGDAYHDQLERTGHAARLDDLDRFADLGVRTLRYPILWERTAPDGLARADWRWADERLGRLRALGMRPIVGLVHHGSGPRQTSLVDPSFVAGLARFARAVAERYPWVEDYTPVNEPLTTARFSGLYGHWSPHGRDDATFARAVVVQCRAIAAAMRAIRDVNPAARLVQTEDLGKVAATPPLADQAAFENERRWLTFDLLSGRVTPHHPMWHDLSGAGVAEAELAHFLEQPCPPDLLGINHYLTSERFLDDRLDRYPPDLHGGNGRARYVDVEAVRVLGAGLAGPETLLRETWERYRRPVAVTEAHLGCTREEQVRWLAHVWDGALAARRAGADVRAVTAWSLLGAYDWDSLLTRWDGHYEPGVFDLRAPRPRPTALARLVRDLAAGRAPDHPVLGTPGWWLRPDRLTFPAADDVPHRPDAARVQLRGCSAAPVLIASDGGPLGDAFARRCESRSLPYRLARRDALDIADPQAAASLLREHKPWVVVDASHAPDPNRSAVLAAACARRQIALLVFSSPRVFSGRAAKPYVESDLPSPSDEIGRSAVETERRVHARHPGALIARVGPLFGSWDAHDPVATALRAVASGAPWPLSGDTVVSPTYLPDLVEACLDLLIDGERGVWHLANPGAIAWTDLLRQAAAGAGLDARLVGPETAPATHRVLGSERGWLMPPFADAMARYARERDPATLLAAPETPPFNVWTDAATLRAAS